MCSNKQGWEFQASPSRASTETGRPHPEVHVQFQYDAAIQGQPNSKQSTASVYRTPT